MVKILTVDDHDIVREGIKRLFEAQTEAAKVGEARTAPEAMRSIAEQSWDIVLLDLSLGPSGGLELLREIKQLRPKLPVLVLSMHSEGQYALRAFKAGAAGYLTKGSSRDELLAAVHKILRGGKYVTPALAELIIEDFSTDTEKPAHEDLSDREYQVLCLIASGKTVGEIAQHLSLSDKTISTYRARILEKMKMKTNAELTHYAIRNHLVE
jgi:two-component system, NarL family, invasion response regulator UvrY